MRMNKFLLLFLGIYILLSIFVFDPKLYTGGDNAVYIILAESIVDGKGYRNVSLPEEPPHTQFPPGFPLLLSLPILLFGPNIIILKLIVFLTSIGAFIFMYKICGFLFREEVVYIMPFYLSIPIFMTYNHWILSEMPFLCLSLGALYFFIRAEVGKKYLFIISFFLSFCAFFIRTAGVSLIAGILFLLLIKRNYRYFCIFLSVFLILSVPWYIRNIHVAGQVSYIDQLLAKNPYSMELGRINFYEFLARVRFNLVFYSFTLFPKALLPIFDESGSLTLTLLGSIFLLLTFIGFIRRIRNIGLIEIYFIFGVIMVLGWPKSWSSQRFLLPILPIFIIYVYFGLLWLGKKLKLVIVVYMLIGICIVVNLLHVGALTKNTIVNNKKYLSGDKYAGYESEWRAYFEAIELIKKKVPTDRIIMARKPEFVYLTSRHKSFTYPFTINSNKMKYAIKKSDFIIIDNFPLLYQTRYYLLPILRKDPDDYVIVGITREPGFYVLQVLK